MSRCLSAPDATSLPPEPSLIFYYLKLNSGIGHTKRPVERGFVRYMPFLFYPASVVLFQLHGGMVRLYLQEAPERHRGRPFIRHLSDSSAVVDPERLNCKPRFLAKREQRLQYTTKEARECILLQDLPLLQPTLCHDICHERYHTLVNFKQ